MLIRYNDPHVRAFVRRNVLLLVLAVLGLLGVLAAIGLQEYSFPLARVEFTLLRDDAEAVARSYLRDRGFAVDGYQAAIAFEVDDGAKGYVERQAGPGRVEPAGQRGTLTLDLARALLSRAPEEEEFSVYLSPQGRAVGFAHLLPEAAPGGQPSADDAEALATALLRASGRDPADYRLISASDQQRPARTDHFFTWQSERFALADATYRVDAWTARR